MPYQIQIPPDLIRTMYEKTRASYYGCVQHEENGFLQEEINVPIDSLVLKEKFVRIKFWSDNADEYMLEAEFDLLTQEGESLGYYRYVEDHEGEYVDEFLVFE